MNLHGSFKRPLGEYCSNKNSSHNLKSKGHNWYCIFYMLSFRIIDIIWVLLQLFFWHFIVLLLNLARQLRLCELFQLIIAQIISQNFLLLSFGIQAFRSVTVHIVPFCSTGQDWLSEKWSDQAQATLCLPKCTTRNSSPWQLSKLLQNTNTCHKLCWLLNQEFVKWFSSFTIDSHWTVDEWLRCWVQSDCWEIHRSFFQWVWFCQGNSCW